MNSRLSGSLFPPEQVSAPVLTQPTTQTQPEPVFWPLSSQIVAALLIFTTLIALGWHGYLGSRQAARPTRILRVVDQETGEPVAVPDQVMPPESIPSQPPSNHVQRTFSATPSRKLTERDPPLDLNTATIQQLQLLPGVGPAMAERIDSRRVRQPFRTIEDLRQVSGIGVKTMERLRPYVTVHGNASPALGNP